MRIFCARLCVVAKKGILRLTPFLSVLRRRGGSIRCDAMSRRILRRPRIAAASSIPSPCSGNGAAIGIPGHFSPIIDDAANLHHFDDDDDLAEAEMSERLRPPLPEADPRCASEAIRTRLSGSDLSVGASWSQARNRRSGGRMTNPDETGKRYINQSINHLY